MPNKIVWVLTGFVCARRIGILMIVMSLFCRFPRFTVNPKRRIKQHNGEMTSGAFRTKSKRPWEMALCIYGFPTNTAALQVHTSSLTLPFANTNIFIQMDMLLLLSVSTSVTYL